MKRQKTKAIWTVLVAVFFLFLPSCEREEDLTAGRIEVFSEKYGHSGGAKLAISDAVSTWSSGDRLRINSSVAEVEIIDGHAYIADAVASDVNRALFPATLASGDLSSDEVTVTLPAAYHYRTDGSGRQVLDIPMAATSSGTNPLEFKHLTGLLCITIKNTRAESITLQSLTVTSNKYQLSGSRTLDFSAITSVATVVAASEADRSTTLAIGGAVTLTSSSTATFLIPVAPVESDNSFTITVVCNNSSSRLTYVRSQGTSSEVDRSLVRNQIGYAFTELDEMSPSMSNSFLPYNWSYQIFEVYTPQDFVLLVQAINSGYSFSDNNHFYNVTIPYSNATYKIMNDIDMSGYVIKSIKDFTGEIDGNGKVISNLTIEGNQANGNSNVYECALFQKISGSGTIHDITLSNLSLVHPAVNCSTLKLAGICAEPSAALTVENCTVSITSVQVKGTVSDAIFMGSIVAKTGENITINNCDVDISLPLLSSTASIYLGALVGWANHGNFSPFMVTRFASDRCSMNCNISANNNIYLGGIMGYTGEGGDFYATDCTVNASINVTNNSNNSYIGAYVGRDIAKYRFVTTGSVCNVSAVLNGNTIQEVPDYNN